MDVQELDLKVKKCFDLKQEHAELKRRAADKDAELDKLQEEIGGILENMERTSYDSPYGKFSYKFEQGFLTPKSDEERNAFRKYLEEKSLFETMWSVNSMSLNSFCKAQAEVHEGDEDFVVPGIVRGEIYKKYSLRK
jgi:hypothetical protein